MQSLPIGFDRIGPHGDSDTETSKFLAASGPSHAYANEDDCFDENDDDDDETLGERLLGLTEMLPVSVRNAVSGLIGFSWHATQSIYHIGRVAMWVVVSSATILALPVMFESERMQMEEQQMQQQRQILLGPNVAMSGHLSSNLPHSPMAPMPQVTPPR